MVLVKDFQEVSNVAMTYNDDQEKVNSLVVKKSLWSEK